MVLAKTFATITRGDLSPRTPQVLSRPDGHQPFRYSDRALFASDELFFSLTPDDCRQTTRPAPGAFSNAQNPTLNAGPVRSPKTTLGETPLKTAKVIVFNFFALAAPPVYTQPCNRPQNPSWPSPRTVADFESLGGAESLPWARGQDCAAEAIPNPWTSLGPRHAAGTNTRRQAHGRKARGERPAAAL